MVAVCGFLCVNGFRGSFIFFGLFGFFRLIGIVAFYKEFFKCRDHRFYGVRCGFFLSFFDCRCLLNYIFIGKSRDYHTCKHGEYQQEGNQSFNLFHKIFLPPFSD